MTNELNAVLDRLDTVACVVASVGPTGCLVISVTPCTIHPPQLMVFTSHENLTHEAVERSGVLAVHPLGRGQAWVEQFGLRSGRTEDKFASVEWEPGETGAPILSDALGFVEGPVAASLECGDHTARLVEPCERSSVRPMRFRGRLSELYALMPVRSVSPVAIRVRRLSIRPTSVMQGERRPASASGKARDGVPRSRPK